MDSTKKTIEAALFMSGRWQSVEDLARISGNASIAAVKEALKELQREYDERSGGIVIGKMDDKYRMEINQEVRDKVYYLAPEPELSPALIKTLALIAYKQPIYQTGVVKVIGNRAYQYIKELRKKEFISIKKKGRTKLISTTGRFNKYFGIPEGEKFNPALGSPVLEEAQRKLDEVVTEGELEELGEDIKDAIEEMENERDENKALIDESEDNNDATATEEAEESKE
jgi:segregation and condensation protein B